MMRNVKISFVMTMNIDEFQEITLNLANRLRMNKEIITHFRTELVMAGY